MLWKNVHMSTAKQKWLKITVSYFPDCKKKKKKKLTSQQPGKIILQCSQFLLDFFLEINRAYLIC